MFKSATFKLTLWYVAIVMAISLAFSVVVYRLATNELANGLTHQTERWYNAFPAFDDDPFFSKNTELTNGRHDIFMQLIYFNIAVLVGAGVASYALARRTLSPIEAAHARQKRFTADVSHELRTPLTALRMESEVALLDKNISKQALRDTLSSNIEESQKLEVLVNNLLRLSQLEAGQLKQHFKNLSVKKVAEEAISHIALSATNKKITISNQAKSGHVYGDSNSLVQLLVALLDNAVKYSAEGSVVQVSSRQSGANTEIIIKDEGKGIEPIALKYVFERFYRADKARTAEGGSGGFGLGLAIAQQIAELHHGHITLTSRVGKGTTATVSLPAKGPAGPA